MFGFPCAVFKGALKNETELRLHYKGLTNEQLTGSSPVLVQNDTMTLCHTVKERKKGQTKSKLTQGGRVGISAGNRCWQWPQYYCCTKSDTLI